MFNKPFDKYYFFVMVRKMLLVLTGGLFSITAVFVFGNLFCHLIEQKVKDIDCTTLKKYCDKNGLSRNYAIVVDFSNPSGKHRFFVCDLKNPTILASSLCAHGAGKGSSKKEPVFSNEMGSNCSSLGHYKITGKHRMSSSGLPSFKLVGLDKTNSNAERRGILIHSAKLISMFRWGIYPFYLPMDKRISSGCFAVDIDMMDVIEQLVNKEQKPILLYAYKSSPHTGGE